MVSTNHQINADFGGGKGREGEGCQAETSMEAKNDNNREKQIGTLNPSNNLVLKEVFFFGTKRFLFTILSLFIYYMYNYIYIHIRSSIHYIHYIN